MRVLDTDAYHSKINYQPHAKQRLFHSSPARFRVAVCGRRFGKSKMAGVDLEPQLFQGKKRFWIVGPIYDLAEKEFRVVWDDLIVGAALGRDKRVKKAYNKRSGDMYIEFPWGTRLECRSGTHPENLVGEALDGVIMSEAAKHDQETWFRFIRPALSDKRGWAVFPTTPQGYNWLYDMWGQGQNPEFADVDSWQFPTWENTVIYPGGRTDPEILMLEQTLSKEEFDQEIAALFTATVGRIYPEFDERTHVRKLEYNPEWPNYIAFDWGYTHAFAAVEFQVDPWDNVYVWREYYRSFGHLGDMLQELGNREQPPGYKINLTFGDAASPGSIAFVNENFAPCIGDMLAKKDWLQGVNLVKRFLKLRQIGEADEYGTPLEEPKLFLDYSCENGIREFNQYRMRKTHSTDPIETGATGAAQRQDDHFLDALRYGLMHLFVLGADAHLSDLVDINSPGELMLGDRETFFSLSGDWL